MTRSASPWWRWLLSPAGWITLGMLARTIHILSLGPADSFGDTAEYEQVALRILHGQGLGASTRAPLYPMMLALSFALGGEENFAVVHVFQLGLALAQMVLAVGLARRMGGPAAAAFAAPIIALTPTNVFVAGLVYPTLLYSTLLVAITFTAWALAERPRPAVAVALGVLVVLGWLTDLVILAPGLALGTWLVVAAWRTRGLGRALGIAAASALVLVAPYWARVRAGGSDKVFMGKAQAVLYFARTDTIISRPRWIRLPATETFEPLPMGAFVAREWRLFRARPLAYTHDYVFEFLHFFQPLPDRVTTKNRFNRPWVLWAGAAWFLLLLPAAAIGAVRGHAPLRARILLAAIVLSTAAFYSFFFTQARYRIPVLPQLSVLAAFALGAAFPRLGRLWADPHAGEAGPER